MSNPAPVTKAKPCPVCGGDHKCSRTADGLIFCGRKAGPEPGFRYLGPARADPQWSLYREEEIGPPPGSAPPAAPAPGDLTRLADLLGLPEEPLRRCAVGYDPTRGCWLFPEVDGHTRPVGTACRYPDGTKRCLPGSRRGLYLPRTFAELSGPLFLVEGASDALALACLGIAAIGRPSNTGGTDHLTALLANEPADRTLCVVGENDQKPDGSWPGRDGATATASRLAAGLKRTVHLAYPPAPLKDVRQWIAERLAETDSGRASGRKPDVCDVCDVSDESSEVVSSPPTDIAADPSTSGLRPDARPKYTAALLKELADDVRGHLTRTWTAVVSPAQAKKDKLPVLPSPHRFKMPVPITSLVATGDSTPWVWDGFLARDGITLLSALPKAGKTTLLAHLLAALGEGLSFCGRATVPGRAVVVSEESESLWAARREQVGLGPHVELICRPAYGRPTPEWWAGFVAELADHLSHHPADLVVFDTLANLWPVKDENQATDVGDALSHLHRLTVGRAVLLVHHIRKSDGGEGTAARGSGALAGFVDVLIELRRNAKTYDPTGTTRVLTGYGRYPDIPPEWVVKLTEDGFVFVGEEKKASKPDTLDAIRRAILAVLPNDPPGMTRKQIWAALPGEVAKNEVRFRSILEAEAGNLWRKGMLEVKGGAHAYFLP